MNTPRARLLAAAAEAILIKDGPYGTAIQNAKLAEADYRGDTGLTRDQQGNNDLVNLTRPALVREICDRYIAAGAHILATNTFNATRISQGDYGAEHLVPDINRAAAGIIRTAVDEATARDGKPRFVAGAIGPTNKTLSLSPDVNDPGFREIDWDFLVEVYHEQAAALIEGGADFILIETVFDTLNAKAGIMAVKRLEAELALQSSPSLLGEGDHAQHGGGVLLRGEETPPPPSGRSPSPSQAGGGFEIPIMLSMTLTDLSGRNLSGHTVEAFWHAVRHARPVTIGLNCSFGAAQLRPHVRVLSQIADTLLMVYPNAGLPNELGEYDEAPETTASLVREWAEHGQVNVLGGCCGSTPEHIAAMARAVAGLAPRAVPEVPVETRLAGLEPFTMAA